MQIRIRATGQVMFENELRQWAKANNGPWWDQTTDEVLEALGADVVFEGPQATGGTVYQFSMPDGVEQINGKWHTKNVLGPVFTSPEQETAYKAAKDAEKAISVRQTRNAKLAETDWRFRSDLAPSQAWRGYCQALRDIPLQSGFPWSVIWPTQP